MAAALGNITRGTLIYGLGQGVNRLLAFITLPLFTAFLSPTDFGVIALLALFGFFARAVFGLGVGVAMGIVYFKSDARPFRANVVGSAVGVLVASSVVLLLAAYGQSENLGQLILGDSRLANLVFLQALVVAAQVLGEPLLLRFQYENRPIVYVIVSVGGAMVGVATALILVALGDRGVLGWVEGYLFGAGIALVTGLTISVMQLRDVRPRVEQEIVRELLRLGYPLVPSFFFLFLIQNSGVYFLRIFEELADAGIYYVGWSIGMAMGVATGAFSTAWFPFFQSYLTTPDEGAPLFQTVRNLYAFVFGLICLCFFMFAQAVVGLVTTDSFHDAYRVVGLVALAQFLVGFWSVLLPGIYFARQVHYVTLVQGAAAAVAIAANFVFIPLLGAEGTALAMMAGMLAMVTFQLMVNAWKRYTVTAGNWGKLSTIFLMIAFIVLVHRTLDAITGQMVVLSVVALLTAAYVAIGWRLRLLPEGRSLTELFTPSGKAPR